jgi:hypothetical protein
MVENVTSPDYIEWCTGGFEPPRLNSNQIRLMNIARLAELNLGAAERYVQQTYMGVISTKSPNDLGAEFCVYNPTYPNTPIGTVIVGGVSAQNHYTELVDRDDPLGRQTYTWQGQELYWVADLPNTVYTAIDGTGAPAPTILRRGACEYDRPEFVCPVWDCDRWPYGGVLIYDLDPGQHVGVDLFTGDVLPTADHSVFGYEKADFVYAPADAEITYAGYTKEGCGGTILLDYGNGWTGRMCHLETILVGNEDTVEAGQLIGRAGNSGNTRDGTHLHIETLHDNQEFNILHLITRR